MFKYITHYFFAPGGRFEPCGMFTASHITAAAFTIIAIVILLMIWRAHRDIFNIDRLIRTSAVLLTLLEIIKISHSFIYGDYHLDAWFPLSYCGLFIFALWFAGFGNERIKRIGDAFITYGCPFAGLMFLIFPTTSLMLFPIWHYFSIYSMFFHAMMIIIGLMKFIEIKHLSKNAYICYLLYVLSFSIVAISLNCIFGCNLMNLREPYNIPIDILQDIYNTVPIAYTFIGIIIYSLIPIIVSFPFGKLKKQ